MDESKRCLFAAVSYLRKQDMVRRVMVDGKRIPSKKMITLPSSSPFASIPPCRPQPRPSLLLHQEDDQKSLHLLPTRSPTTPLENIVNSSSSSSSISSSLLENGGHDFRPSPSPTKTLVVAKEEYKENRVAAVAVAVAAAVDITTKKHERTVVKKQEDEKENNFLITNKKQKITQESSEESKKKQVMIRKKGKEKESAVERRMPIQMFKLITGNEVQGLNLKWLTIKPITESDIKSSQNRLFLPNSVEEIMTSEEIENVRCLRKHMEVHVFDPKHVVRKLKMSYWPIPGKYTLITLWSELAKANQLVKEYHVAEIWTFRNQLGMLCFAINFGKIGDEMKENEDPTVGVLISEASTSVHGGCGGSTSGSMETTMAE
ncbi:hypothetical protein FRX31_008463 [Thalictrum thalictroides]|uniref:B3 domain-containing protein n=1 Tax=Thalictrum thalictroides TaxID=46969 RepID=A0A7J6WZP7_THATH|nr:hypothetical protein FRX31_008463 [Thalictrum thalictroides]